MFIIYDLIFLVFTIIYIPIYLFRGKFHPGFWQRLGVLPRHSALNRPIWVHAVSVGEAMAIRGLVEELRRVYPEKKFVISTVTPTGNKIARGIVRSGDLLIYLPLDFSFIVRIVIDKVDPLFFVIAETEIWPNLISYLYKKKIPTITVNGRISDASFKGYLSIRFLIRPILEKVSLFCVQAGRDKERLMQLGVIPERIRITGNMKFDNANNADSRGLHADSADWRSRMGIEPQDKLFIAASTHAGEEEIILAIYKELLGEFVQLKLLIAPRHPERAGKIERLITKFGFTPSLISHLHQTPDTKHQAPNTQHLTPVFILDTIGQLLPLYAIADIVFVGGSLVKAGGHNILEPAALGKPVLCGAHMSNFRDIADLFRQNQAMLLADNASGLKKNILYLLNNPNAALKLGRRARGLIEENQGATRRNLECIREIVACGGSL